MPSSYQERCAAGFLMELASSPIEGPPWLTILEPLAKAITSKGPVLSLPHRAGLQPSRTSGRDTKEL